MLSDSRSVMLLMSFAAGTFAAGASTNPRHLMLSQPSQGVPNNPLPLIIYPQVIPDEIDEDMSAWFKAEFAAHGWPVSWQAPVFPYTHYHPNTHELLGITCGWAEILFGGESGRMVTVYAGDAVLIPAGVGHQQIAASDDFLAVGAYPPGVVPRTLRDEQALMEQSMLEIKRVAMPQADPITGGVGALTEVWHPLAAQ